MIAKILHRAKQEKRDDNAVIFFMSDWHMTVRELMLPVGNPSVRAPTVFIFNKKKTKKRT